MSEEALRVLNHTPWMGSFPLNPFYSKIARARKSPEKEQKILITPFLGIAINTILTTYTWISLIIDRIDDDMFNFLGFQKKLQLANSGVPVPYDEVPPDKAHFMNLDINSLIIFLDILLDDTSRFLEYLFVEPHFLKFGSFKQLKNSMDNCRGERIDKLNTIFQRTDWYQELNKLRNKPVVHTSARSGGVGMQSGNVGIYLRTRTKKDKISETKFMSNIEIDELCDNIHSFLQELNDFLCINFGSLPLEARKN